MFDLAAQRKDFGALALFGAHTAEPVGALQDDLRDIGIGLDVVENGRYAKQTLDGREGRAGTRLAAVALDRGHESCLLAAHKGAGAEAQMNIKIEAGAENILAKQAVLAGLPDGHLQAVDSDGIFGADINVALIGADGIGRDGHGLKHDVRIALQHRAVHESAGIAFVGIAKDILLVRLVGSRKAPLDAGREAAAAAPAQAGVLDGLDDLLRRHFGQHLAESHIAVHRDVFVDDLRVDDAAVAQRHALLLFVESGVAQRNVALMVGVSGVFIDQPLNDAALEQMLLDDLRDILHRHTAVKGPLRINDHDGAEGAQAEAAGLHDLDFIGKSFFGDLGLHGLDQRRAAGRGAAGAAAHQYMGTNHSFLLLLQPIFPMVYSTTTLPPFKCSATTRLARSAVILT